MEHLERKISETKNNWMGLINIRLDTAKEKMIVLAERIINYSK